MIMVDWVNILLLWISIGILFILFKVDWKVFVWVLLLKKLI